MSSLEPIVVEGTLLDQDVEVVVHPWNRNVIPWWPGRLVRDQAAGGPRPVPGAGPGGADPARRGGRDRRGAAAVPGRHPRRRHRPAVAVVGGLDPGLRLLADGDRQVERLSLGRLPTRRRRPIRARVRLLPDRPPTSFTTRETEGAVSDAAS